MWNFFQQNGFALFFKFLTYLWHINSSLSLSLGLLNGNKITQLKQNSQIWETRFSEEGRVCYFLQGLFFGGYSLGDYVSRRVFSGVGSVFFTGYSPGGRVYSTWSISGGGGKRL